MDTTPATGPRLSDQEFFSQHVDTSRPGLAEIPALVARGDLAAARRVFAAEARASLQPERFLSIRRTFRGSNFMYPGESVAEAAERILRLELISCGTPHRFQGEVDWHANPTYNQYKEWPFQLNRHPEWAILAERYRETGDERYAAGFVQLFRSWVRQVLVPPDAPGNATLGWRTIEAGIRMGGAWQWALHSFYRSPHFDDDVLVDWYKSVWEHGWRLRHFHWTHNWLIMEMNGLAQIGLLYPQFREAEAWRTYALERLVEELDKQVYPDGFQYELTTNYHQVNIRNYQWLWDVYAAYDQPVPDAFAPVLERMHEANLRLVMPDGRLPDVNDGSWMQAAPLFDRAVELYPHRADFRWVHSGGPRAPKEGEPPAECSWAFPYAGYVVLRESWQPDAIWALFDGGPFGWAHQHEDKLNLLLHAYGRLLLTEGGNYAYDTSPMRRYVLSTRAHNTVRVDGWDQNRRAHYVHREEAIQEPAGVRWHFGKARDWVEAAYEEGYGPDAGIPVVHRRRVIFLKRPQGALGPCLLVIDRLLPEDDGVHSYQALWHFDTEEAAVISLPEGGVAIASQDPETANLTIVPARLAGLTARVVAGQEEPEWQGWKAILNHQQGQYAPAPTALVEWQAQGPVRLVTLLYPTRAGEECPVVGVEADGDVAATQVRVHLADGEVVALDEEG
ncbi:heparinase II/III family protein [Litorilinea aerophila]|uniref:Uncharacterized protein n=1 Tax=Litorilinea aerophila TaxID=1204385 RepID=A0A540VJ80_9CHLR|nr:alginate lyase family protein [Litorilinea aerophila]MCC9075634.1 heparinase II/III family protein [Litorilinea aerophila]